MGVCRGAWGRFAFGLGYLIFCHRTVASRTARVLLPLAWVNSPLLSYACTPYGASGIAFGLDYLIFAFYAVLLPLACYHMAVRRTPRALLLDSKQISASNSAPH